MTAERFGNCANKLPVVGRYLIAQTEQASDYASFDGTRWYKFHRHTGLIEQPTEQKPVDPFFFGDQWELRALPTSNAIEVHRKETSQRWLTIAELGTSLAISAWAPNAPMLLLPFTHKTAFGHPGFVVWNVEAREQLQQVAFPESNTRTRTSVFHAVLGSNGSWAAFLHGVLGLLVWKADAGWILQDRTWLSSVITMGRTDDALLLLDRVRGVLRWSIEQLSQQQPPTLAGRTSECSYAAFAHDGSHLLLSQQQRLWSFSLADGKEQAFDEGEASEVVALAVDLPMKQLAVSNRGNKARIYSLANTSTTMTLEATDPSLLIEHLAFSPDGSKLYAGANHTKATVLLGWSLEDGTELAQHWSRERGRLRHFVLSPTGDRLFLHLQYGSKRAPELHLIDLSSSEWTTRSMSSTRFFISGSFANDGTEFPLALDLRPVTIAHWNVYEAKPIEHLRGVRISSTESIPAPTSAGISYFHTASIDGALSTLQGQYEHLHDLLVVRTTDRRPLHWLERAAQPDLSGAVSCEASMGNRLFVRRINTQVLGVWDTWSGKFLQEVSINDPLDLCTVVLAAPDDRSFFVGTRRGLVYRFPIAMPDHVLDPRSLAAERNTSKRRGGNRNTKSTV